MLEQIRQFFVYSWLNFRPADALDILFVSVVLYFLLSWVQRRASAAVAIGAFVLTGAYAIAEIFNLYMSTFVFKIGLTVLIFAFLLVFQDDVRRIFERLRIRALGALDRPSGGPEYFDAIVTATTRMAEQSIGALIVLEGDEAIDVHTHGGVSLGGTVTVPLLLSLFQPESPAHDGAVTIKEGRIQKFGAHLPLSTAEDQIGERGTRHAAALGLAERCDATMVVVSEERGTISVARDGRLEELENSSELKTRLDALHGTGGDANGRSGLSEFVRANLGFKLVSVAVAVLLWLTFAAQTSTMQRTLSVPITYKNVPETLALESGTPGRADVQLAGPRRSFDRFSEDELTISLDLSDREPGRASFILSESVRSLPRELSVVTVEPAEIEVELFELVAAKLPIAVATRNSPPNGVQVDSLAPRPKKVEVYLRKSARDSLHELSTEPIDLSKVRQTTTLEAAVIPHRHVRWRGRFDGSVSVEITARTTATPDSGRSDDGKNDDR